MTRQQRDDPSHARPDTAAARVIARRLCQESLACAKLIARSASTAPPAGRKTGAAARAGKCPGALVDDMFVEVLAYSLRLLEMRSAAVLPGGAALLLNQVRRECSAHVGQAKSRGRNRFQQLLAFDPPTRVPGRPIDPFQGPGHDKPSRLTAEMYEQFCRCTGLSSDVLVGSGENLASLLFYIALHAVLSARGSPTGEQVLNLLRAARECRNRLQRSISQLLAAVCEPGRSLAAPPSRPALTGRSGPPLLTNR